MMCQQRRSRRQGGIITSCGRSRRTVTLCIICAVLFVSIRRTVAQPPAIEGDARLVALLQDAQRANRALYPRGRLVAVAEEYFARVRPTTSKATVTLVWDGAKTRWDYVLEITEPANSENKEPTQIHNEKIVVHNGKEAWSFAKDVKRVVVYSEQDIASRTFVDDFLRLRPADAWYGKDRPLEEMLGPHPRFPQRGVQKYVVNKEGDHIVVERHDRSGGRGRWVASLEYDGNVIESEYTPAAQTQFLYQATWDWDRDTQGRTFLRHHQAIRSVAARPGVPDYRFAFTVSEFDPDYVAGQQQFRLDTSGYVSGTQVWNYRTGKRSVLGGTPDAISTETLQRLADTMRAKGFAARNRK